VPQAKAWFECDRQRRRTKTGDCSAQTEAMRECMAEHYPADKPLPQ